MSHYTYTNLSEGEKLFYKYCSEHGMSEDDIRATSWHESGMIDFAEWILKEQYNQPAVLRDI